MIEIDGAQGEGGGQVLRTSLALSVITGQPFRITRIRANRGKSGLLRQHLTGVRASAAISGAEVVGDELRSTALTFRPGPVRPGIHEFAVGTAGSAHLVLQTVLPPLWLAPEPSEVVIDGGTHNLASPPFDFLADAFLPRVAAMGAETALTLQRWGFYPAGGGRIRAEVLPADRLAPLVLEERGEITQIDVTAVVANLPPSIAQRELTAAGDALGLTRQHLHVRTVPSDGPGNVVMARCHMTHGVAVFTAFGRKGVTAERVGGELAEQVTAWRDLHVPVDEHLADQLLLPIALAGSGAFVTGPPTRHTTTNIDVIARFLDRRFTIEALGSGRHRIALG